MSLAKLAAKLLLVLCTAAKAVLEALNCFRTVLAVAEFVAVAAAVTSAVCDPLRGPSRLAVSLVGLS